MNMHDLESTALSLLAQGKGILAADESLATIGGRFSALAIPSTEETRRAYREMLFTTPGLNKFISGIILFDETIRQTDANETSLVEGFRHQNILPGIKVDRGTQPLAGFPGENITEGLDNLRERLAEYVTLGAKFTKWRAVIVIGRGTPTQACLESNAHSLARFAALSQEAGLLPIVEPEVLMDGAHSIHQHAEATEQALRILFRVLAEHRVKLECMLLKTNMILSGKAAQPASAADVARETLLCLRRTVPAAVPGIVFLSGGQSDLQATENLNAINRNNHAPWVLSFSYGRALQSAALKTWNGKHQNIEAGQQALYRRAHEVSAARLGMYAASVENP